MTWDCTRESNDIATKLICFARAYAESRLASLPGVHYVLSCITGVSTNAKGKGNANAPVRVGVAITICFSPNHHCSDQIIYDTLYHMGLNPTIKPIECRKKSLSESAQFATLILNGLKDHNSVYGRNVTEESIARCGEINSSIDLCKTPANLCIVNGKMVTALENAHKQLCADGLLLSISIYEHCDDISREVPCRPEELKGLDKAIDLIVTYMGVKNFALREGYIYAKPEHALVTFMSRAGTFLDKVVPAYTSSHK